VKLSVVPKHPSEAVGDYAYRILHRSITHVELKPGECISPATVAAELNMSRTPIHKAFSRLTADGLLNVYPQRGSYVSMIDIARVYESVYLRNLLDQASLRVLCSRSVDDQKLSALEENIHWQRFYYDKGMFSQVMDTDSKFHQMIYALSDLENIHKTLHGITQDQQRVRYLKLDARMRWEQTVDEHMDLVESIRNRDGEKACYLSYLHVSRFGVDIKAVYELYPDYFTNWESFSLDRFSYQVDTFYNLQQI